MQLLKYANPFIHNISPHIVECKKSPGIINILRDVELLKWELRRYLTVPSRDAYLVRL
jgi:hypothetical protein